MKNKQSERERESKSENLEQNSLEISQNFTQNNLQNSKNLLSIVVPCYNEELVLDEFYTQTTAVLEQIQNDIMPNLEYEFVFVDDGSRDNTAAKVRELHAKDKGVHLVKFSRNFGKEAGILAGFKHAGGDMVVLMDADLQDPPSLIAEMVKS